MTIEEEIEELKARVEELEKAIREIDYILWKNDIGDYDD